MTRLVTVVTESWCLLPSVDCERVGRVVVLELGNFGVRGGVPDEREAVGGPVDLGGSGAGFGVPNGNFAGATAIPGVGGSTDRAASARGARSSEGVGSAGDTGLKASGSAGITTPVLSGNRTSSVSISRNSS